MIRSSLSCSLHSVCCFDMREAMILSLLKISETRKASLEDFCLAQRVPHTLDTNEKALQTPCISVATIYHSARTSWTFNANSFTLLYGSTEGETSLLPARVSFRGSGNVFTLCQRELVKLVDGSFDMKRTNEHPIPIFEISKPEVSSLRHLWSSLESAGCTRDESVLPRDTAWLVTAYAIYFIRIYRRRQSFSTQ